MSKSFWIAFFLATALGGSSIQAVSIAYIGAPAAPPRLPMPGKAYVSATRDGQTDHSLFYYNFFGFGDRIQSADTLVIGSSHAEFGIDSAGLGSKTFNMGLGGAEGLQFAAALFERYHPHPALIVVDAFTNYPGLSAEAARTVASTERESLHYVTTIWAGFLRDWVLQTLLPRIAINSSGLSFEHPLNVVIIRDWQNADVINYYSGSTGDLFADPSLGHSMPEGKPMQSLALKNEQLAPIKNTGARIVVTNIPYPGSDDGIAREMASQLGARFAYVGPAGLQYSDYHHLNAIGRGIATTVVREASHDQ